MSEPVDPPASGWVPVFPLPNVVFFPHTLLPLHIFEPRYREMVRDALAQDRHIVMGLLQDGWEKDYEGRPPLQPIGCMGRITREQALGDGRWNIILIGIARVRIGEERTDKPYRLARIEILRDRPIGLSDAERNSVRQSLIQSFVQTARPEGKAAEALLQALLDIEDLGILTDVITSALTLSVEDKQSLLRELDPAARVHRLTECLERMSSAPREARPRKLSYPPPLSEN